MAQTADELEQEWRDKSPVPPPAAKDLKSSLIFWELAVPGTVVAIVLLVVAVRSLEGQNELYAPVGILAAWAFWTYRAYSEWRYRPHTADPIAKKWFISQSGRWWLGQSTSSTDGVPLKNFVKNTPERTILQRMFKCDTFLVEGMKPIRHVKRFEERIQPIIDYLESLDIQSQQNEVDLKNATLLVARHLETLIDQGEKRKAREDSIEQKFDRLIDVAGKGVTLSQLKNLAQESRPDSSPGT